MLPNRYAYRQAAELTSRSRFIEQCPAHGITTTSPTHNGTAIDLYANSHSLQLKYRRAPVVTVYQMSINHSVGGGERGPYHIDDGIVFFVFEVGEWLGHFLIIPSGDLATHGYLKSKTSTGKCNISILRTSNTDRDHWSQYWDRYDLLA
jgi:hypothetical protein